MAVVIKYVVVRNGEEKMTFATKKEADAHDRMLDIADNLYDFLGGYDDIANLDDAQREAISLYFAKNSDQVMSILKGVPIKISSSGKTKKAPDMESELISSNTVLDNDTALEPSHDQKRRGGKSKSSKESNASI